MRLQNRNVDELIHLLREKLRNVRPARMNVVRIVSSLINAISM